MTEEQVAKREMHWPTVLIYIHLHVLGFYGLILLFTEAKWLTVIFAVLITSIAGLGVTAGAHRLWAHETYTASWSLRFFLMMAHTLVGVGPIYDWVLAHRMHHKFYGTDRDQYNHKKGFIYSHLLSNLMTSHPDQEKFFRDIDMRDVDYDGFVWIQRRFYWILMPIFGILLPINAPAEYWGESIMNSVFILGFMRLLITIHMSWLVNSAMLVWGLKSGDKYPADHGLMFLITKSYWPNYHYMLPWDYKSGEFGTYDCGCSTSFIKIWQTLGLASGMKTASSEAIREAIGKAATTKKNVNDCLLEVKKLAEDEVSKESLRFKH